MPKKKAEKKSNTNSDLQLKLQKEHYRYLLISSFFKTLRCFFICAGITGCVYFLAGKTTIANLSAIVTTSTEKVSNVYKYVIIVLFILLIFAVLWAIIERQLRKRKVIEMSERIVSLEKLIDKNRSSSYLNKDGSTRKEDKRDV
ncbi:hypothetical protein BHC46_02545 [Snodgrassella alvi]|jgi:uncharacterized membrane protein YesL|uniref:Uncharacterized protein n=1 Tax=Snodgrassella alvi TaxID=1196083 RepID=A0A2N9XLD2_9NEIS|nr:hypothetical protein [Snodgrassella alvi]PIT49137.1 hypothetical protein BHC46_02545 [Snodgrassella alvi]